MICQKRNVCHSFRASVVIKARNTAPYVFRVLSIHTEFIRTLFGVCGGRREIKQVSILFIVMPCSISIPDFIPAVC